MQLTKGYSIYTGSVIELNHRIIKVVKHYWNLTLTCMIEQTFSSHDNLAWHSRITKLRTQYTIGRVPNLEIGKFDSMKEENLKKQKSTYALNTVQG